MQSLALVIHVLLAIGVIGLVLIQHGKGADAGAAFGSGASATVFGSRGSASFLTRATTVLAGLFFLTSITLFFFAANRDVAIRSVTDSPAFTDEAPATPAASDSDLPGGVEGETTEPSTSDLPAAPESASEGASEGASEDVGEESPETAAEPPATADESGDAVASESVDAPLADDLPPATTETTPASQ